MRIVTLYMHQITILTAYNFCHECARVLISIPDKKYEIINENDNSLKIQ